MFGGNSGGVGRKVAVYSPAYGTIRRAIEYGLFYVVVDRCTRVLVTLLEGPMLAQYAPRVKTAGAVALWVALVVTAVLEVRRQLAANPFDPATLRPSRRRLAAAGGAVAVGAGAVVAGWPTFLRVTTDPAAAIAVSEVVLDHANSPAPVTAKAAGIVGSGLGVALAAVGGVVLLSYGVGRLAVGLVREVQYRRWAGSR